MLYSLDRIENGIAVLVSEEEIKNISATLLPKNAKQGDIFTEVDGAFIFNKEKTQTKKAEIAAKLQKIVASH